MKEKYLGYLMDRAQVDERFTCLCRLLNDQEFIPMLRMDENRVADGLKLRVDYCDEVAGDPQTGDILVERLDTDMGGLNCSMLELFVVLAERMEYMLSGSEYQASVGKWFRELLDNVNLQIYSDAALTENENAKYDVLMILDNINCRIFSSDGSGGLFPLLYPLCDQRYVELLVQMNYYINENYDVC